MNNQNVLELTNQTNNNPASFSAPQFQSTTEEADLQNEESKIGGNNSTLTDQQGDTAPKPGPIQPEVETDEEQNAEKKPSELGTDNPPPEEDESSDDGKKSEEETKDKVAQETKKEKQETSKKEDEVSNTADKVNKQNKSKGSKIQKPKTNPTPASSPSVSQDINKSNLSSGKPINTGGQQGGNTSINENLYVTNQEQLQNLKGAKVISEQPDKTVIVSSESELNTNGNEEFIKPIPQSSVDKMIESRRAENQGSLDQFFNNNNNRISSLESSSVSNISKINAATSSARSEILTSEQAAISQIESGVNQAISSTEAKYSAALSSVQSQFQATQSEINSQAENAIQSLASSLSTALSNAESAQNTVIEASNGKFEDGAQNASDEATRLGNEAMRIARERASIEDAKPVEKQGTMSQVFEGGDYEQNKHDARVNACISVGEGYQKSFNEKAAEAAQAFLDARGKFAQEIQGKFQELFTTLQSEHDSKVQEIESAKAEALQSAQSINDSTIQSLEAQKSSHISSLEEFRSTKIAEITNSAAQQRSQIESTGQTLKSQLLNLIEQGIGNLKALNEKVKAESGEIEKADPKQFSEYLASGQANFNSEVQNFQSLIENNTAQSCNSIQQAASSSSQSINSQASQATSQLGEMQSQFESALETTTSSGLDQLTELSSGFSSQMTSLVDSATQLFQTIISDAQEQFMGAIDQLGGTLDGKVQELVDGFQNELNGIEQKLTEEADKAEAAVQPRWKSVVKFIIEIVIAIAVMVAVAALFASGVGPLALIVGAILIGAAGGVVNQLAQNAIDGKPLTDGLAQAAAFGALDGLTALIGVKGGSYIASKIITRVGAKGATQFAIQYTADTVIGGVVDSVGSGIKEVINSIQSGEGFSLGAFVRGFKKDFVRNMLLNAAANGVAEIPPVKRFLENTIGALGPGRTPDVDISTSNIDVDIPTNSVNTSNLDLPTNSAGTPEIEIPANTSSTPDINTNAGNTPDINGTKSTPDGDTSTNSSSADVEPADTKPNTSETADVKPDAETSSSTTKTDTDTDTSSSNKTETDTDTSTNNKTETDTDSDTTNTTKSDTDNTTSNKTDADTDANLSASAIKAEAQGLPPAPPGYRYNQTAKGDLYIQRISKLDANGNELPLPVIKGDKLEWPPVETYLTPDQIRQHLDKFDDGAGYFVPKDALDRYGRDLVGRPDGQFIMTKAEMDRVTAAANGDIAKLEELLGIPSGMWQGRNIVRLDIDSDGLANANIRMASGNEAGANELWIPGGKTSGGVDEAVLDQIPSGSYIESPAFSN